MSKREAFIPAQPEGTSVGSVMSDSLVSVIQHKNKFQAFWCPDFLAEEQECKLLLGGVGVRLEHNWSSPPPVPPASLLAGVQ